MRARSAALAVPGLGHGVPARRAIAFAAASSALWAVLEVTLGTRLWQPYDLMQVVWTRYASHLALLLLLVLAWRGAPSPWRTRRPALQLGRSFLMLVMPAAFALSLAAGAGADLTWATFWIAPVLVLALARGLLGERASAPVWACAALVAVAAALVHPPRWPASAAQVVLPVAMSLSFALYVVATRRLRDEPLAVNLFYTALVPLVLLSAYMPFVWRTPSLHDALVMVGIGAVGLASLAGLDRAAHACGVSIMAPAIGLQLPCAALLHWLSGAPLQAADLAASLLLGAMAAWLWLRANTLRPAAACEDGR